MPRDLLIELGCEDLPARYVMPLAEALRAGVVGGLSKRGVAAGEARLFATPRRIAVLIAAVAEEQPTQSIDLTGPALNVALKDGAPTPAALGFAKKCGVEFSALGQKDGKLHYAKREPGKPTAELIPAIFEETLKSMDELVPKRMRWGLGGLEASIARLADERRAKDGAAGGSDAGQDLARDGHSDAYRGGDTFVRPVSWLVCLLGSDVVPLHRFGLDAQHTTRGHRFHAPETIALTSPGDYEAALKAAKVWAEVASRKAEIKRQIEAEAAKLSGHARITEDLLDEVTALVEWPVVIAGRMEQRFMELPPEVIVATVETNQRYFTVFEDAAHTRLKPVFITIANIESRDVAQIVEGNERVVRPRLSDAMFFWEQDRKFSFVGYREKLKSATYQKELGTLDARVERVANLVVTVCESLPSETMDVLKNRKTVESKNESSDRSDRAVAAYAAQLSVKSEALLAAKLCKNDLVTKMVFEFPELLGLMGGYYARASGESEAVATAIREHYLPTQQGTPIPSTREGQVLALADKLDALAGIFAIGQKPTASKDPYALRRAANGVLRICLEGALRLDIAGLLRAALDAQPTGKKDATTHFELVEFVMERLRASLVTGSVSSEMFEAVKAVGTTQPLDFGYRVEALTGFVALPASKNLAAAHKRIRNLLKQAGDVGVEVNPNQFEHESEHALFRAMNATSNLLDENGKYVEKLAALAELREPVDAFLDARSPDGEPLKVFATDEAVRANRLALLKRLDYHCRSVADISLLPG